MSLTCLQICLIVSESNPLRPLRDLQYGLGETVFGGCRHLEYMNINFVVIISRSSTLFVSAKRPKQVFSNVFLLRFLRKVVLDIRNNSL